MQCSESDALEILSKWQKDGTPIRFGFSGRGLWFWYPSGVISSLAGTVVKFSSGDLANMTFDLANCTIEIMESDEPPNEFSSATSYIGRPALQLRTRYGDLVVLFQE